MVYDIVYYFEPDLCIGKNFPNILRLGRHILMCIYIGIEDLVANALSELTEHKN